MNKFRRPRDLDCPACGGNNRDGKVVIFEDGNIYCHSCGETTISKENKGKRTSKKFEFVPEKYKSIPKMVVDQYFKEACILEKFLYKKFYTTQVMNSVEKYNLGRDPKTGRTAFIYQDIEQDYRYIKLVQYRPDGKRDKDQKYAFYAPYSSKQGFKPPLFGEQLLNGYAGPVNLVESEKTAIIADIYFQEHVWLATGGSNGLTYDKAQHLKDRIVYRYVDCDEAGRKIDRDRKILSYFNAKMIVKDIDKSREDGADIADLILETIK